MIVRQLDFYTDGAFSSKTEMGGWACICIEDDIAISSISGKEPYSTNNRMELSGFLCALEQVNEVVSRNVAVTIYVDSAYICNCILCFTSIITKSCLCTIFFTLSVFIRSVCCVLVVYC